MAKKKQTKVKKKAVAKTKAKPMKKVEGWENNRTEIINDLKSAKTEQAFEIVITKIASWATRKKLKLIIDAFSQLNKRTLG